MAAHHILTVGDGVIEIPEDLQNDPCFQNGARVEVVPVAAGETALTQGDWRRLRGMFKDANVNFNDSLDKDRLAEHAADERMLRGRTG